MLPHRRYFESGYPKRDRGGLFPLVLFVFETAEAEETFLDVAAQLRHAPFASSHSDALDQHGVLGESWRLPPPEPPERWQLHDLRHVPTCPTARAGRFL